MKQSTFSAVMANSIKNLLQGYTKGIRFVAVLTVLLTMGIGQAWGETWEKVTSAPTDWSGDYLIVYEDGKVAFDGSRTTLDAVSNTFSVTISNGKITTASTTGDAKYFTIAKSSTSYTIKSKNGYYIGQTSNANGLTSSTSTTYANTLSLNSDGTVNIVSSSAYLRYNSASDQKRFRYYNSGSYTGQKAICLYKKVAATPTLTVSKTSLSISTKVGAPKTGTFTFSGSNLTSNATLTISGTHAGYFKVTPTSKTLSSGSIATTTATVTYSPEEYGTHTATLTVKSGTASKTVKLNGTATCSYNINYTTNNQADGAGGTWSENNCFEQVGSTTEWRYEMTLPGGGGSFWVGNGAWVNDKSEVQSLSTITFVGLQGTSCGKPYPGEGAVGYVRIYSDSGSKNYYAAFQPTYQIAFGIEGGTWQHKPFALVSDNKYETALLDIPADFSANYKYYVGPKNSANTTNWVNGKSSTDAMNTMVGMTDINSVKGGKGIFRIYDNSCDNNWYCSFIPYYNYKLLNDNGSVFYASDYVSSEATNKATTIYATKPTKTGYTFIGWSRTQNATTADVEGGDSYNYWKANDTFYPVWKADTYTITSNLTNCSSSPAIPTSYTYTGSAANLSYTISAASGYRLPDDITVSGTTYTWDKNTGLLKLTGTISGNVTITIEAVKVYNITWKVNKQTYTTGGPTTSLDEGSTYKNLTLPTAPANNTLDECYPGKKFVGWSTTNIGSTESDKPSILFKTAAEAPNTAITENTTLYAVFATETGGGTTTTSESTTLDFSAQGYENQATITSLTIGDITAAFSKGSNSNAPKYYTSGTAVRVYGGGYFTVTASTGKITEVIITTSSGEDSNTITADCGTYTTNTKTWTGSASSVTFTVGGSSGHRRIKSLAVTHSKTTDAAPTYSNYVTECCTLNNINLDNSGTTTGGTFSATTSKACEGEEITLSATAAECYAFVSWTIKKTSDGSDVTNSVLDGNTLTMPDYAVTVYATFKSLSVTEIALSMTGGQHKNLDVGETNQLVVTYTPADATCDNAIDSWTSSDDNVMSVTDGLVKALRAGTATITATTEGGVTATYTITVNNPTCDSWYIHYWNNSTSGDECFYKVKPDDPNDHEWRTNNFSLPSFSDEDKFIVNNTPEDPYKTDQVFRTGIGFADIQRGGQNCGTNPYPGQDAYGQLSIYDDSETANRYIAFYPAQYLVTYGKEGAAPWEVLPLNNTTGYEYETEPFMVPNGYKTDDTYKYYVGITDKNGNIKYVGYEFDGVEYKKSSVDAMNTVNGLSNADMAGKWGTWHIYSNSCANNWYCEFIHYYRVDFNLNGGEGDFASRYGKATTPYVEFTTTDIGAPTRTGYTFLGWKDQNNKIYAPTDATVTINNDFTLTALWKENYASDNCRWEEVTINDIEYGDEVVIATEKDGVTYALQDNDGGATTAPLAVKIIINPNKTINTLETSISTSLIWNVDYDKEGTKNLVIYSTRNAGEWLYSNAANDGIRIGTNANKEFKIVEGTGNDAGNFFLYHNAQARYLGVYYQGPDWRGYTSINSFITGQTLKFYKKVCLPEGHYRVTWMVNGQEYTDGNPTTIAVDGVIENIPTAPDDETLVDCEVNKFMGWSEDNIGSMPQQDAPTDLFTDIPTTPITENKTFYAVFAKVEGGGESITWKETFDTNEGTGGNDGQWSGTIASSELLSDHTWSFYNAKGADQCAKFASNSNGGSATTPEIDCGSSTDATLTFKAGSWKGDETTLNIESTNCTVDLTSVNLPDQKWEEYTINITNIIGKITITFYSETKKRFFLDEVEITSSGGISYSNYITLCDNSKVWAKYDLNGGTGASACTQTLVTKDAPFNLCSETPTKDGYTFNGWSDGTKTYAAGAEVIISKTTTFYATWKANTITITWDLNYADSPEAATSEYVYDGEDIDMPEDPTREGYKFDGWYTASTDGKEITEVGETNKPTSDVTYYAHWAELYTVTFMASGQVYVVQEHKYLSGETLELPADPSAANYACDGYIFEGWSAYEKTKEDATLPELVSTSTTIDADKEFYALWKKASSEGAGETIFYESFNDSEGTGGNDDKWSGDIATSEAYVDNNGWEGENVYGANKCIKLGSGKAKGYITTPTLSSLSGKAILTFKAAAWDGSNEQTDLILSITGGGTLDKTSVTITKGAWQDYEVTIYNGTSATQITFAGKNASDSRFFLDEVNITTSGSYNYTTLPNCGPTIVAKDGMWVTSADGQSVKVNVPIAVKSFTTTATITGTSANENFEVTRLENVGNGINNVLEVIYTPTTANSKESATITLTAKDGEIVVSTTTFTLNGRSLPDQFAIVVDKASEYYALPANMPAEDTYLGFGVEVNDGTVTAAPKTHLYTMRAVHSTRFAENGTAIRLVGNNNACLWASSAKDGTGIRNYAQVATATDTQYEWNLYTEDGDTYRISCTAVTEEGRILRMYGQKFGMYKSGSDVFRLLPVECTSTPLNVSASAARTSATISWTNAEVCDVEVYNGSTKVQTISAATSPVVVSGLAESTAYTFTLTPTDNAACVASGAFTTTGPTIDIVEWETDGIVIQVDKDDELNPKVVIKGEEEHGDVGGNVADELFFSKYFEAHAENKLLAIFNGTTATIDLTGYTIKSENGTLDLSQFGQTKGKVASNEEIILVYYDAKYSAEECAEIQKGYENWNILTDQSVLAFSGRGSLGLYKNDVLIDVIGSTFPSGELTKIGKSGSPDNCGTDENVRLHIDGVSVNDQSSFFCFNGDNIKTDNVETDYALSTNRCLLIRKNTVTSGANAVATNKADEGATCGDLSSTFATLCSEWSGYRIGSGKSSTDEIKNATCDGLGYVGGFDYNNYYRTLETIGDSEDLEDYTRNADENTYFITIDNLAQYSCLNIQLQLTDANGNVLTEQTSQVPILVTGEKSTTDEIFSAIVKDSETSDPDYENSKIRCSTCDVVILKDATLTKADADTENDINQVRDIYVYPGGRLIVPTAATDFSVNNISMRRVQDDVATANVETPLLITSSSNAPIYVDVRINAENWHWFTLPYDCNIADVTWVDGSKPKYNADWFLMYYDGESRAASTNPHDNHWKVYEGTKIEAGKGYIVGITGHASKPAVKFELRFPMAQEVLTAEQTGKTVAVNAWGVKSDNTPNNKGWNLVGNPYLNYYQPETEGFSGLSLLKYTGIHPVTGERLYQEGGTAPFLVTPVDGGWYEYQQELASEVEMNPFTAYFVQVGDPNNPDHTDGMELHAEFVSDHRGRMSLIRRAPQEVDGEQEPVIVRVEVANAKGESDKTTLIIDDRFTNEYEMNGDFFKWFGDYYRRYTKPVLYSMGADHGKRAFNALSEQLAAQPVALGMFAAQAGDYTFSLTRKRCDLSRVEEVWLYDATTATYTNLMQQDYTFTTAKTEGEGRFYLSVKMKQKTPTAVENVNGNLSLVANQQTLVLSGLPAEAQVWVYDATGKLLHSEHTTAYQRIYPVQQAGVYFVSVKGQGDAQTLSTIVK